MQVRVPRETGFYSMLINYRVLSASSYDVQTAINHAQDVFKSGVWSKASATHRSDVLHNLSARISEEAPILAQTESMQTGRTLRELLPQIGRIPHWMCVVYHSQAPAKCLTCHAQRLLCCLASNSSRFCCTNSRITVELCTTCSSGCCCSDYGESAAPLTTRATQLMS